MRLLLMVRAFQVMGHYACERGRSTRARRLAQPAPGSSCWSGFLRQPLAPAVGAPPLLHALLLARPSRERSRSR